MVLPGVLLSLEENETGRENREGWRIPKDATLPPPAWAAELGGS